MELGLSLVRAELRRRLGTYLAIVVVVAVTGAVALVALAGARRTASAFERHLEAGEASDLAINIVDFDPATREALDGLPGVERTGTYAAVIGVAVDPETQEPLGSTLQAETVASVDGRFFDFDRPAIASGRLPDPDRADEIIVNRTLARTIGVGAGDALSFLYLDPTTFEPVETLEMRVTGVGITSEEVAVADIDDLQRITLTPAFLEEHPDAVGPGERTFTYFWSGLRLAPGTDVDEVEAAWEQRAPARFEGEGTFRYRRTSTLHAGVQRANRPQVVGLGAFGALATVLALGLTVQATRRAGRSAAAETATLRALGASRLTASTGVVVVSITAVVLGTILAVGGAVALSPLTPIGLVRDVEPDPGIRLDGLVLALGALLVIAAGVASAGHSAWRSHRTAARARADTDLRAASRLPLVSGFGVRRALGRGSGAARSAVTGAVVATVAIVATLTFGADLRNLTGTPRLFGSDFDAAIQVGAGYSRFDRAQLDRFLEERDDPDLEAWASVTYGLLEIDGVNVAALGVDEGRGSILPSTVDGRAPAGPGEVVLGEDTLADVGAAVGEEVEVGGATATVVGTAVLPALGQATGDHAALGVGAWLSGDDLRAASGDAGASLFNAILLRLRDGAGSEAVDSLVEDLNADVLAWGVTEEDAAEGSELVQVLAPARPAELVGTSDSLSAPAVLSAVLAVGALAALGFALVASVRQHRRELALLKALGFVRRQLVGTVAVQAAVTVGVGLLIGVPLGIVLGGALWRAFAEQLGVLAETTVPVLAITATAGAAIVLAVVLAVLPSRAAAQTPAARVLRAE